MERRMLQLDRVLETGIAQTVEVRLQELSADIVSAAYLLGDFVLSSGSRSNYYFDKYLFETRPSILRQIVSLMSENMPPETDRLAGPELGGVALTTALSLETGLPFVIIRKELKEHGTSGLVEGEVYPGEQVLVVEDVVSTGARSISAANQVARTGARVVGIYAVIDREQGGSQNIEAAGYRFRALFRRRDLRRLSLGGE